MRAFTWRSAAVVILACLLAPQVASAQGNGGVPSGNSAITQYLESIPTASGSQPTNRIRSHHSHSGAASGSAGTTSGGGGSAGGGTSGGGGGGSGSGGGTGGGAGGGATGPAGANGASNGGSSVSGSTYKALASQGTVGAADAAFARATAPRTGAHHSSGAGSSNGSISPSAAVLKSLTGSSSNGGLGALLPAILVVAALAGGLLAIVRWRIHRTSS